MSDDVLKKLCELVKRKCKITWEDEDTERRVIEIVENADESMRHRLAMKGTSAEAFLDAGPAKTLVENYCMYDWNNMLDEFETNYKRELIAERHRNEVKNAKEENEQLQ